MAPFAHVVHYTDPACPWAWNAEPLLLHLRWRYRAQLTWETVLVGLTDSADEYVERGYTAESMTESRAFFAAEHPMPIGTAPIERVSATAPGCRAVIAAQLHAPTRAERLLRALRVEMAAGRPLDADETITIAAAEADVDGAELLAWMTGADVDAAYAEQKGRARHPSIAALAQDDRLADRPGGRRYTCPSLELVRIADSLSLSAPGFQPWKSYELAFGNLLPLATRHPDPETVAEIFAFAPDYPLATAEVAQLRGIALAEARAELVAAGAVEHPLGNDAFWSAA